MIEEHWRNSEETQFWISRNEHHFDPRLWRLCACAIARQSLTRYFDERFLYAIEVAERFADGGATLDELTLARKHSQNARNQYINAHPKSPLRWQLSCAFDCTDPKAMMAAKVAVLDATWCSEYQTGLLDEPVPEHVITNQEIRMILLDILGDQEDQLDQLFTWSTPEVIALAERFDHNPNQEIFPRLHGKLIDAGCEDDRILNHCTQYPTHFRGCWLIDHLLKKR